MRTLPCARSVRCWPSCTAAARVPVGALAVRQDGVLTLSAQVTSLDGREQVTGSVTGTDPEETGTALAAALRERGADAILDRIREPTAR